MRTAHDNERDDQVPEVGRARRIQAAVGQRDQIDAGLDDAEEERLRSQDLLPAEPIEGFDDQERTG
ncbi:MAG: hypothetical protein WAK54_28305 [Bradyrhizobium sp.]